MFPVRLMGKDVTLDEARVVIEAMLQAAESAPEDEANPAGAHMGLAVVDTAGVPVYVIKMDAASSLNVRIAINKGFTAIETRRDTRISDETLKKIGRDIANFSAGEPRLTYIPGGVLLRRKDGLIAGAIGSSGRIPPTKITDEEISQAGARAFTELQ